MKNMDKTTTIKREKIPPTHTQHQEVPQHSCYSSASIWHTGFVPDWKSFSVTTSQLEKGKLRKLVNKY